MTGARQIYAADIYAASATADEGLQPGALGIDEFGDLFRYVKVGASNISAGKLQIAPAPKTNHHNCAVVTAVTANGRNKAVTITLGATAAVAQEYFGGVLNINAGTASESYRIASHPAASSAANLAVTVERPFITSLTTSSKITLTHNRFNGVVEAAVATRRPAGVPLVAMTASYYGWLKTRGTVSLLADQAIALGSLVAPSGSVAGAVVSMSSTFGTAEVTALVGQATILAGVDTEYRAIHLLID